MSTNYLSSVDIQEKKSKLSEAASHVNAIKLKLNDLKITNILPAAQIKDITNTLDSMMSKAYRNVEKEERMSKIS